MIRVRVSVHGKVDREVDLDRELIVGRKAPADVVVADGQVSSRHLRIRPDGGRALVTDLGSTNGSRLDGGDALAPNVEVALAPGQKLVVGPAVIEVVESRADAESSGGFGKAEKTVAVGRGAMENLLVSIARFQAAKPRLVVAAEHAKSVVDIKEMEVVIGREGDGAQVVVPHQSVSSKHAKLAFEGGKFVLTDLGSSNGTFVDGERIAAPTPVAPQTAVTFGTVDCLFVANAPEAGGAEGTADPHAEVLCAQAVHLGKATEQQAREVLAEHRSSGRSLGELFVAKGLFGPREWAEVYRHRATIAALRPAAAKRGSPARTFGIVVIVLGALALAAVALMRWLGEGSR